MMKEEAFMTSKITHLSTEKKSYGQLLKEAERHRKTEEKVRSFDAYDVVLWIHELEDIIYYLENKHHGDVKPPTGY